mgnify:CR=1 FL=1
MAIIISVKYSNYRFNATISDTFNTQLFRGRAASCEDSPDDYDIVGYSASQLSLVSYSYYPQLNASYRALRKWVDTTELEQGKYPVARWALEFIGEDHKGTGIVRAKPIYSEED